MRGAGRLCLSAVTMLLAAVLLLALLNMPAPASAQPSNPAYATFDIDYMAGKRKTAAWTARVELQVFITAGPIDFYRQVGVNGLNTTTAPAGSFLMIGGTSDIWISIDGFEWYILAGPSTTSLGYIPNSLANTFPFVYGQCFTKDRLTDRLYVIRNQVTYISPDGGKSWFNSTASNVNNRAWMYCTVDQAGNLYSIAGDRTYISTDQGLSWSQRSNAPWSFTGRVGHFGGRYYSNTFAKDLIYVMGGGRPAQNDVWVTSDGALTWVQLSANAAWPARYDTRLGITQDGVLIVAGGRPDDSNSFNDVWTSVDGGYNWWLVRNHASFTPRGLPGMVVDNNGYFWVFGGSEYIYVANIPQWTMTNKISRSTQSFTKTSVQQWLPLVNRRMYHDSWNCVGLVCWPAQSCQCATPNDFNFNIITLGAPFSPRFASHVRVSQQPIQYVGRDSNGAIATKTAPIGSYFYYGGMNASWMGVADGWVSTGLTTWEPLFGPAAAAIGVPATAYTPVIASPGQAHCSKSTDSQSRFYTMGGDWTTQVFMSTDARNWQVQSTAFSGSSYGICGVAGDWRVWHMQVDTLRYSSDNGVTWTTADTQRRLIRRWAPFGGSYTSTRLNAEVIIVMGGVDGNYNFNDVWFTTDWGVNWYLTTTAAAWPARADASAIVDTRGVLIVMSGQAGNFRDWFNDAWFSLDGGYNWYELTSADAITTRAFPAVTLHPTSYRIVSIGGNRENGGYSNDVYYSDGAYPISTIRTWGPQIDKTLKSVPAEDCLGLTCLPNATCLCGPRNQYMFDIRYVNNVPAAPWVPRFNVGLFRTSVTHSWKALRQVNGNYQVVDMNDVANSWVLYGGGSNVADVWVSSNKGQTWEVIAGVPGNPAIPNGFWDSFKNREGQGMCKDPYDDTLYIMGGKDPSSGAATSWVREVWRATDGQDWIQMQDGTVDGLTVWPGRAYLMCAVDINGKLYATGGNDDGYGLVDDDTYVSGDGGASWSLVQSTSSYPQRAAFFGGSHYGRFMGKSLIYAMGGISFRNYNDVWVTSDGARTWLCLTSTAPWSARADTSVAFSDSGVMVLYGGQFRSFDRFLSDVWMSLDGGYNWWQVVPYTTIRARSYAGTLLDESGYLWVIGGNMMWTNVNDVYRSTLTFTDSAIAQWAPVLIPGVVIPQANGLACWPGKACTYTPIPVDYSNRGRADSSTGGDLCPTGSAASSSSSLSGGAIAGIVIGVIAGVVIIAVLLVMLLRGRGDKSFSTGGGAGGGSKFTPHQDVELSQTHDADHETA